MEEGEQNVQFNTEKTINMEHNDDTKHEYIETTTAHSTPIQEVEMNEPQLLLQDNLNKHQSNVDDSREIDEQKNAEILEVKNVTLAAPPHNTFTEQSENDINMSETSSNASNINQEQKTELTTQDQMEVDTIDKLPPKPTKKKIVPDSDSDSDSDSSEDEEEQTRKMYGFAKKTNVEDNEQEDKPRVEKSHSSTLDPILGYKEEEISLVPQQDPSTMKLLGTIYKLIEALVIIRVNPPPKDSQSSDIIPVQLVPTSMRQKITVKESHIPVRICEGSVLFNSEGKAIGKVCDIFGPIQQPFYTIRYPSPQVMEQVIQNASDIFYNDEHALFFDANSVIQTSIKGYDRFSANDEDNNDFSDDEQEKSVNKEMFHIPQPLIPELESEEAMLNPDLLLIQQELSQPIKVHHTNQRGNNRRGRGRGRGKAHHNNPRHTPYDATKSPIPPPFVVPTGVSHQVLSEDMSTFKESSSLIVEPTSSTTQTNEVTVPSSGQNPFAA
ncbi:H/ACA ribonucleoprotein complex non-core subunit [Acrasis kona]|uniref:H/ACA ribonucleoprotein complex non-core subunit NAF1 n=1 Tax=Acrasis kona TaxID=1008807 RepID=A0AAW2YMP9_9EUKA